MTKGDLEALQLELIGLRRYKHSVEKLYHHLIEEAFLAGMHGPARDFKQWRDKKLEEERNKKYPTA